MEDFISVLESEFSKHADAAIASQQKAYLKGKFEHFGLKTTQRRELQKPFLAKEFLPPKSEVPTIIKDLWNRPEREYHYFAQELAQKYVKQFDKTDIELFEFMVIHNSWWDTIDFIATKLIGTYFKKYPETRDTYVKKWLATDNIWLQRCCLLFQLKYKDQFDPIFLEYVIDKLLGSTEFFINKAIGWVLREYSRTNPEWVLEYVDKTDLSPLSKREALRLIK